MRLLRWAAEQSTAESPDRQRVGVATLRALDERGVGEVDDRIRAMAAAKHVPGTDDDWEGAIEDQPA